MNKLTVSSDAPGAKLFMLGNEAIARGAVEAGVQFAAAYPGTPSSEILDTLAPVAKQLGIYVEWSANEKVAFEVAYSASLCGLRAMASMKQVGLNVAHDPLMTSAHIGAIGGFVLLVADDPWAWSSQNEQDNRYVAEQAYLPVLEPSSVAEAKDMMVDAFKLSEEWKHPVIVRSVTRISHGRGDVVMGEIIKEKRKSSFTKDRTRFIYVPAQARKNRPLMLERFRRIKEVVNTLPCNQLSLAPGTKLGIIACGLSYSYALEAVKWLGLDGKVSILKIGTPHPLPETLVKQLLNSVPEVLVVEELEPFVENHTKVIAQEANIPVKIHGKELIPLIGELSTRLITEALAKLAGAKLPVDFSKLDKAAQDIASLPPARPPTLCPGCPHRATQYAIKVAGRRVARQSGKDTEPVYTGDIGCYTLSYIPPLESMDTAYCMGSSIGAANGFAHVLDVPVIAQIGDSTFFHAGMPPLVNAVANKAKITMVVLDNAATAMTGFQPHPGTGRTAMGEPTIAIKPEDVARACGVKFVEVIDPFNTKKSIEVLEKAIKFDGPALVVARSPCVILDQRDRKERGEKLSVHSIDQQKCQPRCDTCVKLLGCPAIVKDTRENGKAKVISVSLCTGCGLCAQICPYQAIEEVPK